MELSHPDQRRTGPDYQLSHTPESVCERERVLLEQMPRVRAIAGGIHRRLPPHVPLDDLVQAGCVGLIDAWRKFDPSRNSSLGAYAYLRIRGAILDSLRELDWPPRPFRQRARRLEEVSRQVREQEPKAGDADLASAMGISPRVLRRLKRDLAFTATISLESLEHAAKRDRRQGSGNQPSAEALASSRLDPYGACLRAESGRLLAQAILQLPGRQTQVIVLYYYGELSLREVGALLGVGESRVCQIHAMAIAGLRRRLGAALAPGPAAARCVPSDRHFARGVPLDPPPQLVGQVRHVARNRRPVTKLDAGVRLPARAQAVDPVRYVVHSL